MNINEKISKDGDRGAEKSHYHLQGPSKNKEIKPGMEGRTSHRIDPVWEMPWTVGTLPNIVEGLSRETGHQSRERWSSWEHTIQRQWEGKSLGTSVALQSIGITGQCEYHAAASHHDEAWRVHTQWHVFHEVDLGLLGSLRGYPQVHGHITPESETMASTEQRWLWRSIYQAVLPIDIVGSHYTKITTN